MKPNMIIVVSAFLFFHLLSFATFNFSFCSGSNHVGCIQREREALLRFKQDLTDPSNRLASWIGDGDCCKWAGVVCDNFTGHVLQLNLRNPHLEYFTSEYFTSYYFRSYWLPSEAEYEAYNRSKLGGKINPSLLELKDLIHLDLSYNDFEGIQIPRFLSSMENLRYLNLSRAGFGGMIPQQLGNLSNLQYLDLYGCYELYVENLMWISSLSLLKHLDLSEVDLNKTSDHWLLKINSLPFLEILRLSWCQLQHSPQISIVNFSSLTTLDLSGNRFDNSLIPNWIFGLNHLVFLGLSGNGFEGPIPNGLENLTSLTHLDLSSNFFNSTIPSWFDNSLIPNWMFGLNHLVFLDLSWNDFSGPIPNGFENLTSLTHLRLSGNDFQGPIPNGLENLTSLTHLDLSENDFQGSIPNGLQKLTSLTPLDLSFNHFNSTLPNWLSRISHLEYLSLVRNNLHGSISRSSLCNLTSLRYLELSYNNFNSSIPNWLLRFSFLEYLSLSGNDLQGRIPRWFGGLCNLKWVFFSYVNLSQNISEILDILSGCLSNTLEVLVLRNNRVFGHLTEQLGQFKNLKQFDLGNNSICGSIPSSLGKLSSLRTFSLAYNKLNGTLSEAHFVNLTRLQYFYASETSISLTLNSNWVPPFQLWALELRSCQLGPHFPSWLLSQKSLKWLDISNTRISDAILNWFWKTLSQTFDYNLSHNQIFGEIPNLTDMGLSFSLDLSSNKFSGLLPQMSLDVNVLDLSNNNFSGSIFPFLCQGTNETRSTQILNIENNSLSGELPNCWTSWQYLNVLNLGNNNFTGNLPTSMGSLSSLQSLILRQNSFFGLVPFVSLINCTKLETLDAAENQFGGNVLTWIGERLVKLKILILRSNKFHGLLPMELCHLVSLQILDLADNNLFGNLPSCFDNFSSMVTVNYSVANGIFYFPNRSGQFQQHAWLVWKGTRYEYYTTLNLVRAMDLSRNNFSGVIPREVASLQSLNSLNLSHNSFTGNVPESIGDMISLDSMDFSANQLSGEIPWSISKLTFLSYLNLSNNKLTGKIPSSTQLQSFDASSFVGNDLCGPPLDKNCIVNVPVPELENNLYRRGSIEVDWFYVCMALGFMVGFWGVISPLIVNKRWRYSYCLFLDRLGDKFYCVIRKWF